MQTEAYFDGGLLCTFLLPHNHAAAHGEHDERQDRAGDEAEHEKDEGTWWIPHRSQNTHERRARTSLSKMGCGFGGKKRHGISRGVATDGERVGGCQSVAKCCEALGGWLVSRNAAKP
eukprot:575477-Rhodomonas_salina.2